MRLTFLGTGTSFGVPQIGCDCEVCRSEDPRDKRTRSGALLETEGGTILLDTPPELRLQLIAAGISKVDAVLYTHEHADHINGIDDLRIFSVRRRDPLPLYGPPETPTGCAIRSTTSSMTRCGPSKAPPAAAHHASGGARPPAPSGRRGDVAARLRARHLRLRHRFAGWPTSPT
jgi:ribonuclease BN (tRNA processing enzyme)